MKKSDIYFTAKVSLIRTNLEFEISFDMNKFMKKKLNENFIMAIVKRI